MKRLHLRSLATVASLAVCGWLSPTAIAATFVSTELVLSVDVSGSIDNGEFLLQRSSYASVFRNPQVIRLIESLDNGIAVTFQYWATQPGPALRWHHVTDRQSAFAFANAISRTPRPFEGFTNIAAALNSARRAIQTNRFTSDRQVIDVSSDGRQNARLDATRTSVGSLCAARVRRSFFGTTVYNDDFANSCLAPLRNARRAALTAGITINGLPILTEHRDLGNYFRSNVIGGAGSFIQPASGFSDFQRAITEKVGREIRLQVRQETRARERAAEAEAVSDGSIPDLFPDGALPIEDSIVSDNSGDDAVASVPEPGMTPAMAVAALVGWYLRPRRESKHAVSPDAK